jgi:hypothetical protein
VRVRHDGVAGAVHDDGARARGQRPQQNLAQPRPARHVSRHRAPSGRKQHRGAGPHALLRAGGARERTDRRVAGVSHKSAGDALVSVASDHRLVAAHARAWRQSAARPPPQEEPTSTSGAKAATAACAPGAREHREQAVQDGGTGRARHAPRGRRAGQRNATAHRCYGEGARHGRLHGAALDRVVRQRQRQQRRGGARGRQAQRQAACTRRNARGARGAYMQKKQRGKSVSGEVT